MLSKNDRWLLAISTGPSGGTFPRPSTTGRQTARSNGGAAAWTTLKNICTLRLSPENTQPARLGPTPLDGPVGSGPELSFEAVLGVVDRALVGTRGEVLPPAVTHHEHDVRALTSLDRLRRLAQRCMHDRTRRDPCEDPLGLQQLADPSYGVPRTDREPRVDQRGVVQLGDEPLVEVAQPVDQLAVAGLGRDDPHFGLVLAEVPPDAHQGAGGAEAGHEVRHRRQVLEDLRAGALVMGQRVRGVSVLVEHHPVGMLLGHLL